MQVPEQIARTLHDFDRGLRCRWSEALGRFSVERRHGFAGIRKEAVLETLYSRWKQLERESDVDPANLLLETEERKAYDQFVARRDSYQPLLYLLPRDLYHPAELLDKLAEMDIRRAGGALGYASRMKAREERAAASKRASRRDMLRGLAEDAYLRARSKKDFHAQGGDPFTYRVEVPEEAAKQSRLRTSQRHQHERELLSEARR